MRFRDFLKDKLVTISFLLFAVTTIEIFLWIYPIGNFIKLYIPVILLLCYWIGITIEYIVKRKFYQNLFHKDSHLWRENWREYGHPLTLLDQRAAFFSHVRFFEVWLLAFSYN